MDLTAGAEAEVKRSSLLFAAAVLPSRFVAAPARAPPTP
jgi:hypothetical protein